MLPLVNRIAAVSSAERSAMNGLESSPRSRALPHAPQIIESRRAGRRAPPSRRDQHAVFQSVASPAEDTLRRHGLTNSDKYLRCRLATTPSQVGQADSRIDQYGRNPRLE